MGNVFRPRLSLCAGDAVHEESTARRWSPQLVHRGITISEEDSILPLGDGRDAAVTTTLSQGDLASTDMSEWNKSTDEELINNLRWGVFMVSLPNSKLSILLMHLFQIFDFMPCRGSKLH